VLGVAVDITDRKLAQEHQSLMVRELDHRVKNNLYSVQALAEETAKSVATLDEFIPAFSGRIRSIAVAHEALALAHWQGVDLRDLMRRLIEPYRNEYSQRFTLNGEPIIVPPSVAPSLCMVLHELITNSQKHGSLSVPSGRVEVQWTARNDRLHIVWRELDGPPVKASSRRGFGTELIEGATSHQLRGTALLRFDHPQGVICELNLPLPSESDWQSAANQAEQGAR
jgi:two-component sensor histidine kinase